MAVLRIENLGKAYQLGATDQGALIASIRRRLRGEKPEQFWALKDISFDVQEGEILGILGHNGAGKSTLLKILSQITTPTVGRISIRGRLASLLEVGSGFHQELTGRENVYLNGAILGLRRHEVSALFDEIVEFAQSDAFIDTPVKRYSTGMRVRLAFAVAAHLQPEILIIDEVLAVGDAAFQQKCLGKMSEVAEAGRTVLFVSHHAATVESLCRRGIVLDHGRMVFDGTQVEALAFHARQQGTAETCLRDHKNRKGTGEVRATGVEFRSLTGEKLNNLRSGEGLEVHVHYESREGRRVPQLVCDITLASALGMPVVTQSSLFSGQHFKDLPPEGTLICRVPSLPVVDGPYRCNLGLYPVRRKHAPYDELAGATELHVIQSDYLGFGKMPSAVTGDGPLLVRAEWRHEEGRVPGAITAAAAPSL